MKRKLRMPLSGRRVVAGLLCLGAALFAEPGSGVQAQSSGGSLRVEVELVTVEVIAQDKKGEPVLNLKKEDFRLFDDGKEQPIVSFDVVSEADQPLPTSLQDVEADDRRGKVVLILFDDSTITPAKSTTARESAEKYVREHMRPWDFFGVATFGLNLKIIQNLTHDAGKVVEAIRQPAQSFANTIGRSIDQDNRGPNPFPGQPQQQPTDRTDPFGLNNPAASQEERFRATNMLRSLGYLANSLGRVKGRKSILLFSEDLSVPQDLNSELRNAIDVSQRANVAFYSIDAKGLDSSVGAPGSRSFLERPAERPDRPARSGWLGLDRLARAVLPAAGLLADPAAGSLRPAAFQQQGGGQQGGGQTGGGQTGGGTGGGGQTGGGQGGGGQTGGQGGQTGGQQGGNQGQFPSDPNSRRNDPFNRNDPFGRDDFQRFERDVRMDNVLRSVAHETGGFAIFNTNNLNEGLDKVDLELSNYYLLGFAPTNAGRDRKFRKLEVKTKAKGVKLKYRKGYSDHRPPDELAGSKRERTLMSAIDSPQPQSHVPLAFSSSYFYDSPQLARVPIFARIKGGTMEVKKKGSNYLLEGEVMGVAYAEDGSVAARFSESLEIMVDKEREEALKTQDIPYKNYFKLRPGKYRVKLAVSDQKGKLGTAEETLSVPQLPEGQAATSSLIVTQQLSQLPELIQNIQVRLLDEADPLIYKGLQITPPVETVVEKDHPVALYYKIYNLKASEQSMDLAAKLQFIDAGGQTIDGPALDLDDVAYPTGPGEVAIGLNLPMKSLAPGKYKVHIETQEASAQQSVVCETEITLQ
ncbi:MAG: VWA domain-containing protein [Acidobacteriota bacterium]